ncbi:hypothetical protein, partial [Nonomuraea sp. JJY05]|uniref:hypothetical protein n=1 Tax=Nonomuraea sp. JJY05 TaxID=3350255 RepID=UPI00373F129D
MADLISAENMVPIGTCLNPSVELARFGGHLISGEPWFPEEGVCCAEQLSAGVSPADGGAGA